MADAARKFEGPADLYRRVAAEARLSPLELAVYSLCRQAAEEGRLLEPNDDMIEALSGCGYHLRGYGGGTLPGIMKRLEAKGLITRNIFQRGRQVCITETGECTAPPRDTSPHWRLRPRKDDPPAPAIQSTRQRDVSAFSRIEQFAREERKHVTEFLVDLVYIGLHAYEAEREQA